jgi:hypothetical protein
VAHKQTPLLEFESSAFAVIPGEDEQTNPGIYGKALAEWLAVQLRAAEFSPGAVVAEDSRSLKVDYGSALRQRSESHSLGTSLCGYQTLS